MTFSSRRILDRLAPLALPARPLRTHIVLMVLIALLPSLVTAIATGAEAARRARDMTDQRLRTTSRSLARAVEREAGMIELVLTALASSSRLDPVGDARGLSSAENSAAERLGARIGLYTAQGALITDTGGNSDPAETAVVPASLSRDLLAEKARVLTEIRSGAPTGASQVVLAVPVLRDGRVAAWLGTVLTPLRLADMLRPLLQAGRFAAVVDGAGHVLASVPPIGTQALLSLSGGPLMAEGPGPVLIDGHLRLVARTPIARTPGWQVIYGEDAATLDDGLAAPELDSMLTGLVAICMSLLLAGFMGSRLARPLRLLTAHARAVAIGAERPRDQMRPSAIAEFEALRLGMARADAVLRRRGAAERMALREARTGHELLVSVVNATAEHITVKDLDLRCVLVNRALLTATDPPLEEWQVLGRSSAELFSPEVASRLDATDRAVLATGRMTSLEMEIPCRVGPAQWRWITTTPWRDAGGQVVGVVTVSHDVTDRRAAEARLRALQADLLRATRLSAMGAMASGLAHELNQPLAAATNYLNAGGRLLDQGLGQGLAAPGGPPSAQISAARHAVTESAQQLLRAGEIVRRLRDFVGRGEAELEPEEIGGLIHDACDLARRDGLPEDVSLQVRLAESAAGGRLMILADRTQLQQVLLNLVRNAAEAMASHGARDALGRIGKLGAPGHDGEIVISVAEPVAASLIITISDNGPGIPPRIADRLFQPFVSTKPAGMGIGLVICHTIVEGHGGQLIHARTASGAEGSVFRIALPIPQSAGEHEWPQS